MLAGKAIVLGVTGGIAAYKAAEIVRLLVKDGATVRVVMTRNAQEFITPLTLQTLSGNPVSTETFSLTQESEIGHIRLADTANLLLVAPATANVIAKLAHGLADDLLTTVVLATTAPVLSCTVPPMAPSVVDWAKAAPIIISAHVNASNTRVEYEETWLKAQYIRSVGLACFCCLACFCITLPPRKIFS